jgi:hypothetical protein
MNSIISGKFASFLNRSGWSLQLNWNLMKSDRTNIRSCSTEHSLYIQSSIITCISPWIFLISTLPSNQDGWHQHCKLNLEMNWLFSSAALNPWKCHRLLFVHWTLVYAKSNHEQYQVFFKSWQNFEQHSNIHLSASWMTAAGIWMQHSSSFHPTGMLLIPKRLLTSTINLGSCEPICQANSAI